MKKLGFKSKLTNLKKEARISIAKSRICLKKLSTFKKVKKKTIAGILMDHMKILMKICLKRERNMLK